MNRRTIPLATLVAALALTAPKAVGALDLGLSVSGQSFGSLDYAEAGILPGLYARGGAIVGIFSRLELEPYVVIEAAPDPLRACMLGADATIPLLGSRETGYFNMFLSAGFLQGFDFRGTDPVGKRYLSFRLTPLAIGDTFYGRRDRMFTAGVLYELEGGSVAFIFNILDFDFFASRKEAPAYSKSAVTSSQ